MFDCVVPCDDCEDDEIVKACTVVVVVDTATSASSAMTKHRCSVVNMIIVCMIQMNLLFIVDCIIITIIRMLCNRCCFVCCWIMIALFWNACCSHQLPSYIGSDVLVGRQTFSLRSFLLHALPRILFLI